MSLARLAGVSASVVLLLGLSACSGSDDPKEQFRLGHYDQSLSGFEELAEQGDLEATNYLGVHYYIGAGAERDFLLAAGLFETAALGGFADAQKNLGVMYYRGLGVAQDFHRAFGWMYHAHVGGNTEAYKYLDLMQMNVTPNASGKAINLVVEQLEGQTRLITGGR